LPIAESAVIFPAVGRCAGHGPKCGLTRCRVLLPAGVSGAGARREYMNNHLKNLVRKLLNMAGYEIRRTRHSHIPPVKTATAHDIRGVDRIQYACGPKFLPGWVNVDCYPRETMTSRYGLGDDHLYYQADLGRRQPFADQTFVFAFAEDFIEHLHQAESIIFLFECHRVLRDQGVLRLSFPGLEGVLTRHFSSHAYGDLTRGREEAYDRFRHLHFYSRAELALVAEHIGFSSLDFVQFGKSEHEPLRGLETREGQQDLNIYAELRK
jgi:predicted SAM-dependent methyltransferase